MWVSYVYQIENWIVNSERYSLRLQIRGYLILKIIIVYYESK